MFDMYVNIHPQASIPADVPVADGADTSPAEVPEPQAGTANRMPIERLVQDLGFSTGGSS